ncbi:MAG: M28 family metallopeptidase [Anaerolineales bacterium]
MTAIDHITFLAREIGPRGSTQPEEALAAEYAAEVLASFGLKPEVSSFMSAKSNWHPYTLFAGIMLISFVSFLVGSDVGNLIALILAAIGLVSVLLELSFRSNILRWILPKAESQNVSARVHAREIARRKVVLIGHLDTHRTPIAFSTDAWLKLFGRLIPLGLVASVALIALFALGFFNDGDLWRALAWLPAVILAGVFAVTLQADFTPYTHGANDNATGAGIVLSIAEELASKPLRETEVWFVLTGCEEVGCYGAEAFAKSHERQISGAMWLTIDTVGGKDTSLAYLTKETFLLTTHSDLELLGLADEVASELPELRAERHQFAGAFTEGAVGGKHRLPVLTLIAVRPDGSVPNWHRSTDTLERIDELAVARCETFLRELLHRIDSLWLEGQKSRS